MPADGNIFRFPTLLREVPSITTAHTPEPHPWSNTGTHGFPPVEDRPRVDVSGCMDGYRVWLFGRPLKDFTSLTNASRCAAALMTLDALDVLDGPSVMAMFKAAVAEIEG